MLCRGLFKILKQLRKADSPDLFKNCLTKDIKSLKVIECVFLLCTATVQHFHTERVISETHSRKKSIQKTIGFGFIVI